MKRSRHISTPTLTAMALALATGCHQQREQSPNVRTASIQTSQKTASTERNGFGETYGPWLLGGAAVIALLSAGS